MPHFGLINTAKMTEADAVLLRVKLHIRGGRRRFERGMFAPGMVALFDALRYVMRWYIMFPDHRRELGLMDGEDFREDQDLFALLVRAGVIDRAFGYSGFEQLVERSLDDASFKFDSGRVLAQIVQLMTELEAMPFDETQMPPEKDGAL